MPADTRKLTRAQIAQDTQRPRTVRSVRNAMAILRTVCEAHKPVGVTEIAELVGLSKPTVHALLATLRAERLVYQDADTRRYSPGWELAVLSQSVVGGNQFIARARQELPALAEALGETVFLAVAEESAIVILDSAMGRRPVQLIARPGSRVPIHASAAGKVALAWSPRLTLESWNGPFERFTDRTITDPEELRRDLEAGKMRGYQRGHGEHQLGISSISVPVLVRGIGLVAIFTTALPADSLTEQVERGIVTTLRAAAERVTREFEH